jgi:UDP-2,3-diacylglucosamine pyrophosphatase LpxH
MTQKNDYRSIFISDVHLGTRGCQAAKLVEFLDSNTCDNLYLVGDIIDGWRLKKRIYWPQDHSEVIRKILTKAKNGTKVYYIIGNHDEVLRKWLSFDLRFGRIKLTNRQDYISIDGKKYLIVHGDMFDSLMRENLKWIMHAGDIAYNFLIWFNTKFNSIRKLFGFDYWSLSKYLKSKTKNAVNFIDGFEQRLANYARDKGYDGVICGHIHCAADKKIDNIHYLNCGDWVEGCTAITETRSGKFQLIDWSKK